MAQIALGLSDFVGMVREGIVDAAAVDVQVLAKVLHGNAGALDVPARIPHTPGRIPLQGLILKLGLGKPEHKIIFILLVCVLFHAFPDAHGQVFLIMVVEDVVFIQSGRIEVYVAAGKVCLSLVQQRLYHMNIFINTIGGRLHHIRPLDIQFVTVREESIGIVFCDLHDGFVLPAGAL